MQCADMKNEFVGVGIGKKKVNASFCCCLPACLLSRPTTHTLLLLQQFGPRQIEG
jgi:hypothetical protein